MFTRHIFFVLFFLISQIYSANAAEFLDGFEDIPLMNGFRQITAQDFSFGNEETGYTETSIIARKNIKFDTVKAFYNDSLTALGWHKGISTNKTIIFHREHDSLEITQTQKNPLKLLISLKSKN